MNWRKWMEINGNEWKWVSFIFQTFSFTAHQLHVRGVPLVLVLADQQEEHSVDRDVANHELVEWRHSRAWTQISNPRRQFWRWIIFRLIVSAPQMLNVFCFVLMAKKRSFKTNNLKKKRERCRLWWCKCVLCVWCVSTYRKTVNGYHNVCMRRENQFPNRKIMKRKNEKR